MKKFLIPFLLMFSVVVNAQSVEKSGKKSKVIGHADKNSLLFNVGLGQNNIEKLPFYFNMEYFATNDLSLGWQIYTGGYRFAEATWKYKTTNFGTGLLVNYHLNTLLNVSYKWDFYVGATSGYNLASISPDDWNAPDATLKPDKGIYFCGQAGLRYYFGQNFGLNAEGYFGNMRSGANFGITFRL